MPNIDPSKTADAIEKHAKLGLTDLDREARTLNGSSGAANRQKLARQYSELPRTPWDNPQPNQTQGSDDGGSSTSNVSS